MLTRTDHRDPVVHNQDLAVNIDLLSDILVVQNGISPQPMHADILGGVDPILLQQLKEGIPIVFDDALVLIFHHSAKGDGVGGIDLPLKSRLQGQYDEDMKLLSVLVGLLDSVAESHPHGVLDLLDFGRGIGQEKLILDVDEMLGLIHQGKVRGEQGAFGWRACGPVGGGANHLGGVGAQWGHVMQNSDLLAAFLREHATWHQEVGLGDEVRDSFVSNFYELGLLDQVFFFFFDGLW